MISNPRNSTESLKYRETSFTSLNNYLLNKIPPRVIHRQVNFGEKGVVNTVLADGLAPLSHS